MPRALLRRKRLLRLAAAALGLALPQALAAQPPAGAAAPRVHRVAFERDGPRLHVLLFADAALEAELEAGGERERVLRLPGARLDPDTPRRHATPAPFAPAVALLETPDGSGVRVFVETAPGVRAELARRGELVVLTLRAPDAIGEIPLEFRETELAEIVGVIAEATGQGFVFDDRLRGRVTLTPAAPVGREEALALLDAALQVRGFAAVPAPAGMRSILPVPLSLAKAPLVGARGTAGDAPVVTRVRLEAASPSALAEQLRPLFPAQAGVLVAHEPTRSLILAGSETAVRRWLRIAQALDAAGRSEISILRPRHRSADELAELLDALRESPRSQGRDLRGVPDARGRDVRVVPDTRSNALVLVGAPDAIAELREHVDRLDRAPRGGGELRVIRLRHADPERLAEIPRALAQREVGAASGHGAALGPFSLVAEPTTRSLVVMADPATQEVLADLVAALDRAPPQIVLDVLLLDVELEGSLRLDLDALIPLTDPDAPDDPFASVRLDPGLDGTPATGADPELDFVAGVTRDPLMIPVVDANGQPATVLIPRGEVQIAAGSGAVRAEVRARPQLVGVAGEEHEIFVGNTVPIRRASSPTEGDSALVIRQDVERQEVGLRVRMTPTLAERGRVRIQLDLELSEVAPSVAGAVEEVGPTLRSRRLSTALWLAEGQYAVVGLADRQRFERIETGAPFLRDVPILGRLVRGTRVRSGRSEFVLALRAARLRTPSAVQAHATRARLAFERGLEGSAGLGDASGRYAVHVTSAPDRARAEAIADSLEPIAPPLRTRVTAWSFAGSPRFGVWLLGARTLAEAGAEASRLVARGFEARVVPLPPDAPWR